MKLLTTLLPFLPLTYAASLPETSPAVNNIFGGDENDLEVCLTAMKEISLPYLLISAQPVGCSPFDIKCMCGKRNKFFKEAKNCIVERCGGLIKSIGVLAATRKVCQVCI